MTKQEVVAAFLALLPAHECGLRLTHNTHKDYYQTAAEYLADVDAGCNNDKPDLDYCTAEDRAACVATNEVWDMHWYPRTPVGFHHMAAPTLERLMERAVKEEWV